MQVYGILGHPVAHSRSPAMQRAAFDALGIAAHYDHFDILPTDLATFMQQVREEKIAGLSVTIPHKIEITQYLDEIDSAAQAIGAVNTVYWQGDQLVGTNTDWQGAVDALEEIEKIAGKEIAVLGTGGAARAVVYGLQQRGAGQIYVFGRDEAKLAGLATDFGIETAPWDHFVTFEPDIVIHATPLGLAGEHELASPISPGYFRFRQPLVYDLIYSPAETLLLREAAIAGCRTLGGLGMFVRQGAAQFTIWTGKDAPVELMQQVAKKQL